MLCLSNVVEGFYLDFLVNVLVTESNFAVILLCYVFQMWFRVFILSGLPTHVVYLFFSGSYLGIFQQSSFLISFKRLIRSLLPGPGGSIVTINTSMSLIHVFVCSRLTFQSGHDQPVLLLTSITANELSLSCDVT